jgi:hypothetical protein
MVREQRAEVVRVEQDHSPSSVIGRRRLR